MPMTKTAAAPRRVTILGSTGSIGTQALEVIAANPKSVEDYRAGKGAALNFLKGQVMKLSKGKANPQMAEEMLRKKLSGGSAGVVE